DKYLSFTHQDGNRLAVFDLTNNNFIFNENKCSAALPFGRALFMPEQNQLLFREGDGISIYNPFNLKKVKSVAVRMPPLSGSIINTKQSF
ncbi:MAG: hypothetical protein GY787_23285, partial [Alteromonadales bacterium]|nr:hypothetical protein [Alteromonadales bacterium]